MAASSASHSTTAHAWSAEAATTMGVFLVSEEDAVDEGVGALSSFEGFGEGFFAAAVDAVGEDDQGFAALLFFHEFAGGEVHGIVEKGAAAVAVTTGTAAVAAGSCR